MCTVAQTINPALNNLSFDFGGTLRRSCWSPTPQILVAHPSLPANSVKELIALAKADPNGLVCRRPGPAP